jgi:hypothetical protein
LHPAAKERNTKRALDADLLVALQERDRMERLAIGLGQRLGQLLPAEHDEDRADGREEQKIERQPSDAKSQPPITERPRERGRRRA